MSLRRWTLALCVANVCAAQAQAQAQAQIPIAPTVPGAPPEMPRPGFVPPRPEGLFQLPPVPVPPSAAEAAEAPVLPALRRVAFVGNTLLTTAELQVLAAPYLNRPAGDADLEALRLLLTRAHVDRGYVNSGLLLRRVDAGEGLAEFEVIEGRLSAIQLRGMERLQDAYVTERLQRPDDGPLNLDVLRERFQLLLGDPLFDRLNARLLPGAQRGEAILDLDVTRATPYQLNVFANNYRPVSIGAGAMGLSGWVRNLTGYGDVLDASLQAPVEGISDVRGTLSWRLPLNQHGTQLSLALDQGTSSVVEQSVRALDIKSRLSSREAGLSQTLHETLTHKISIGLNAAQRENRTSLQGEPFSFVQGEPTGETRERLWRLWQEFARRSEVQVLALRSTFSYGHNNLQPGGASSSAGPYPTRHRAWLGQLQFARQMAGNGAQFIVRGSVQRSPDRLLALDGMAIGGIATVRGYRENQLVRDQGQVLNIELEWPLLRDGEHGLRIVGVPFFDYGRGWNHGEAGTTLRSAGLATRLSWYGLSVDLTLARRLHQPTETRSQGSNLQDKGIQLQIGYRF